MVTQIQVALIAALSALLVSFYQVGKGYRNQRALEELKSALASQQADQTARRDYKYKALQRLYEEYEPLRFQLVEAVESAKSQIEELGKQKVIRAKGVEGILPSGRYLLLATIYHLLLPGAVFRIIRRRLTLVDLRLDPQIELQYALAKRAFILLADDARVAQLSRLDYTPYVDGWREKRIENPSKYRRQGLPLGRLENAVEALVVPLNSTVGHERVMSFGEFEQKFGTIKDDADVRSPLGAARDLFQDCEPANRPVLWHILLAQYLVYKAILLLASGDCITTDWFADPSCSLTPEEVENLHWKRDKLTIDQGGNTGTYPMEQGLARYMTEVILPEVRHLIREAAEPTAPADQKAPLSSR
jgi:hypothetical protein